MDLGTGTVDILYRDPSKLPENWTRIVAPSPALVHMEKVKQIDGPLFVDGWIVGGGPFKKALIKHATRYQTVIHPRATAIIKNNARIVREAGVEISTEVPEGATRLWADELRIRDHLQILENLGEPTPDGFAVAVQDHGGSDDGLPDRAHRFSEFKEILENDPRLEDFAFGLQEVPTAFRRLRSAAEYLDRFGYGLPFLVMDTVFAGLLGCLQSRPQEEEGVHLLVNLGNSHTTAALVDQGKVLALFEHHTRLFRKDPDLLPVRLDEFCRGVLTEEGVREDGGCGAWYRAPGKALNITSARCSGPRRQILADRRLPGGQLAEAAFAGVDPMMVGPIGLAEAWDRRQGK
jgi:uncharacterized protein (DUF1786 family)